MAVSEAARVDLYNGLVELLGRERAETLMAFLPTYDLAEVATKGDVALVRSDLEDLRSDVGWLRSEFGQLHSEVGQLRSDIDRRFDEMNGRIDRLHLTLAAGLFVIVAAMAGMVITVLAG